MEDVKPNEYQLYLGAFKSGYTKNRPWPEKYRGELDIFIVGSMLWVVNWVLIN